MHKRKSLLFLVFTVCFSLSLSAQTIHENSGWLAWFNTYKFSKHFGLTSDVQFRSADDWQYVRNILMAGATGMRQAAARPNRLTAP